MSEMVELKAEERTVTGSEAAKKLRKLNSIPGIIYGGNKKPQMVALPRKELWKQVETGHFLSTVYTLDIEGKKERVIPREVQLDPVRDFLVHVDFMRVSKSSRIDVEVPVHFIGEADSPGLKRGGTLNIVRHEVELSCPADAIPENIEISLEGYDIGDSIHISAVKLPANVTPTIQGRDFTIATIVASSGMKSDEEEAGSTATEGEDDEK
ncbi:MAG: 50S ribosomal protein L25/general stress protein Ctc [Hyphomicrobiales bacterium]|nr:50S ribosomal protein L25/general stress protein Ctc [Hyphomicrobiales bacterium]